MIVGTHLRDFRYLYGLAEDGVACCLHVVPATRKHRSLHKGPNFEGQCEARMLVADVPAFKLLWEAVWLSRTLCFAEPTKVFIADMHSLKVWDSVVLHFEIRDTHLRAQHRVQTSKLERKTVGRTDLIWIVCPRVVILVSSCG